MPVDTTAEPQLTARYGQAWPMPLSAFDSRRPHAVVAGWLVNIPEAHPVWDNYGFTLIHLRDLPGHKPAEKSFPEATHEILVIALNPEHEPNPDAPLEFRLLKPVNVVAQFICESDERAAAVLERVTVAAINGRLHPEPQGIEGGAEAWAKFAQHVAQCQNCLPLEKVM